MAAGKSGSFSLQGSNGVTMKIYWSEEYDVSTNKSTVAIEKIEVTSSWYYGITYYLTGTIKINSKTAITMNSVTPTHRVWIPDLNKYGEVLGDMGSVSVTHESDGSKKTSIAVDLKGYTDDGAAGSGWSITGSQEITLTTITPTGTASIPTVSKSTVAMLEKVTINTNRKNTSYTHDLTYSFGGQTGSIATDVGASYQWTVPDLVAKIPDKTSATCTITCTTKNGSTVIGTKTVQLTLTVPSASEPAVSEDSVVMLGEVTITSNRKSESFTHDLTYSFGGSTGTIATGVGASYKWTVPDLVAKIPGKTSATCTITCKTMNGSAVVGTKTVKLTLTVPAKSTPSASASTVQMGTSVNIYTNRNSKTYRHTLKYSIGDASGTIDTDVAGGRAWTPPKDLASKTGNKVSATCTITCETYNGTQLVGTATTQIILNVPDATVPSLSASSIVLGESITIYTPREVSCYEHFITYKVKNYGSSDVVLTKDFSGPIQESYEWTPSATLLAPLITGTKGTIVITCTTKFKDSDTVVGTAEDAVSFTFTIPDDNTTKPEVAMTVTPVDDFNGFYLAGKSKVQVSYEASSNSSTIASYHTKIGNKIGATNPYTSDVLNTSGTVTITGEVVDARGYSTVLTEEINVIPYSRPRIIPGEGKNKIICQRCNSDGNADPGGVYLMVQIGRKYNKVVHDGTQQNFCKLSYQWKTDAEADSGYSDPVELLAKTAKSDYVSVVLRNIVSSNTEAYNIRLIAEDDVGESDSVVVTVPTAFVTFHAPIGGHGFTLGGYHDPAKYDVFDCKFDAEFPGNVSGKVYGLGELPAIPEKANFNDYKDFGVYSVSKNTTATTLLNCPSGKAGTLRVWSSNGRGYVTGDYVYTMQEYVCYDNSGTYRRSMQLPNPDSAWEYGDWKLVAEYTEGVTEKERSAIYSRDGSGGPVSWRWRKYSDGTAECWARVKNEIRDIKTEFGNMYYADCDEVDFPFSFYTAPVVNATVESGSAMILMSWQGKNQHGTTTASKPASYRVVRPTTITGTSFTIAYHAIGRWK